MNPAQIFVLGVTHRTMALRDRELLALTPADAAGFADSLAGLPGLQEFVVLSTCNRLEVYGLAAHSAVVAAVAGQFTAFRPGASDRFQRGRLELRGAEAIRHLLDVAVGLDSQVLGETEIFGQLKKAYAAAVDRGSVGPVLNRLFQKTFQAAKRARAEAGVTEGAVSVANIAVDAARIALGGLAAARVLLIGAGEIGTKAGRAFRSRGAPALTVSSRCPQKTAALASELGAETLAFPGFAQGLAAFDIVVCSTAAPAPILLADRVSVAMNARAGRALVFIDLSMPRNIDPAVAGLPNVHLFNLEDLARIAAENREARQREFQRCAEYLADRAARLWSQVEMQLAA